MSLMESHESRVIPGTPYLINRLFSFTFLDGQESNKRIQPSATESPLNRVVFVARVKTR